MKKAIAIALMTIGLTSTADAAYFLGSGVDLKTGKSFNLTEQTIPGLTCNQVFDILPNVMAGQGVEVTKLKVFAKGKGWSRAKGIMKGYGTKASFKITCYED